MPKEFYTEKDIEDLVKSGVLSLIVNDEIVLTELAYEKARRLGMQLVNTRPENPPSAPVRPYLGQQAMQNPSKPAVTPLVDKETKDLHARIKEAVVARMGSQVDPALLDVIIQRVLKSTGVK